MNTCFINIPQHLVRHWSGSAIASLAYRFSLPNTPFMQDWPWEVADIALLDKFLQAYHECADDECFVLMDILLQCMEELGAEFRQHPSWPRIYNLLDTNITRHIYTVWYWACTDCDDPDDTFKVACDMRALLTKHAYLFK